MEVSLESLLTSCRAALQNNLPALARALSTRIYRVRLHGSFEIGLVINSKATQRDWSCGLVLVSSPIPVIFLFYRNLSYQLRVVRISTGSSCDQLKLEIEASTKISK